MAACQPLAEYAWLVEQIRINSESMAIESAVTKALDDMPDEYTIKALLMNNRAEVTQMCITEEKGKSEGKLEALIGIIKSLDLLVDKAMDVIGIAANEKEKYAALVKAAMQP